MIARSVRPRPATTLAMAMAASTVLVAASGTVTPAGAAGDAAENYRVSLSRTPPVVVDIGELGPGNVALVRQKCPDAFPPGSPFPVRGTPFACRDVGIVVKSALATVTGTAKDTASGEGAAFTMRCDFVMPARTGVTVTLGEDWNPNKVVLDLLEGTGRTGCAWNMRFSGDSPGSLSGTATGSLSLWRVPGQQLVDSAVDLDIVIVAGSGPYRAAAGGTGTYVDVYSAPWEPESASAASPAQALTTPPSIGPAGRLHFRLGHKASRARLVPVVTAVAAGDPRGLQVVAPPRSKCTGRAALAGQVVGLGKTKVGRSGMAAFQGTIRTLLPTPGTWKVSAVCKVGHKKLATKAGTVTVT